jgi:hypothetical protein
MARVHVRNHHLVIPLRARRGARVLGVLDTVNPTPTVFRDPSVDTFTLGSTVLPVPRGPLPDGLRELAEWEVLEALTDTPIAASLGRDVLSRFDVRLDLAAGQLTLEPPGEEEGLTEVPITWDLRMPRVETRIGGRVRPALLDLGCMHAVVRTATAETLGLPDEGRTCRDHRTTGGWFEASLRRAGITVGGVSLGERPVACADAYDREIERQGGWDAVLGLSTFEGCVVRLSFSRSRLAFAPP